MLQNKTVLNVLFVEDIKQKTYAENLCCHWHSKIKTKTQPRNNYKAEYIKLNLMQSFLTKVLLSVIAHIWTCNC